MIDGLRGEFPQVFALAGRIPNPRFARASPMWAVAAGFGAGFFVSAVFTVVFSLLFRSATRELPVPAPFELARLASTAGAIAVAWIAGGRIAVAGYVGIIVLERLLGLPTQVRFCSQVGPGQGFDACSIASYLIALWPQLLGAALAFALVRWLRAGAGDRNPTLEAAGVLVIVQGVGGALVNLALGPVTAGSQWPLYLLLVAILGGIAMGFTILRRAIRQWRSLGIIAFVLAAEFVIVSLPTFLSQVVLTRGTNLIGPFELLAYFSPIFAIAAAALVLYMSTARKVTTTEGV
jgi:hypothetical protein